MSVSLLELSFESGNDTLSVRSFTASEAMSSLFTVSVVAASPLDDIDLDAMVGHGAAFRVNAGTIDSPLSTRVWTGICSHFEQTRVEPSGLSTYSIRIVPHLWLLTLRQNSRIFQHLSIPEIVEQVLGEWQIKPRWTIDKSRYPRFEYRVQYGESDHALLSRLLEEAGIAYFFELDDQAQITRLVLSDAPCAAEARAGAPIPFYDSVTDFDIEHLTRVSVGQRVRQGAHTIRDFDFKRRLDFPLVGRATSGQASEDRLERYEYDPGAFLVEATKASDAKAASDANHDDKEGTALAQRGLEWERHDRISVGYETNAFTLSPGTVFSTVGHPHPLFLGKSLLALQLEMSGSPGGDWTAAGRAIFTDHPYRPPRTTPRPRITGVQSAIVVGPAGQEIHTDEHGRVRVQFHWDREGKRDEHSSCWIRVSQGWAGGGYGMITIPRIGQEVTVGFFEGDPDNPVVVGRVYNNTARVPYALPKHKTRSGWRSDSTPKSDGYNEIMFEDQQGAEVVQIQAQRDLEKLVKHDEVERTGHDRTITVEKNRTATVGKTDSTFVGARHEVRIQSKEKSGTSLEMTDGHIVYTTGQASLTIAGPDIALDAGGSITIVARSGDVVIKGGPNVKINCN